MRDGVGKDTVRRWMVAAARGARGGGGGRHTCAFGGIHPYRMGVSSVDMHLGRTIFQTTYYLSSHLFCMSGLHLLLENVSCGVMHLDNVKSICISFSIAHQCSQVYHFIYLQHQSD
jgi:hypothetical protein